MSDLPTRNQIKKGMKVGIELKIDQGTGKLTEGTVKEILTSYNSHPHGIKVELESGQVGRVKKLSSTEISSNLQSAKEIRSKNFNKLKTLDVKTISSGSTVSNSTLIQSSKFEDLDKKEIPKVENKFDEFKEFYQYDQGMDNLPDSIPNDQKSKIIEDKKQLVRERFVTAVSSFGNDPVGGFVYLGIKSDGIIMGLDKDKRAGNFSDYDDDFANHIRNTMETFLDDRIFIINKLQIKFTKRNDKTICIIQVLPALEPLFLHTTHGKEFYVRGPTPRAEHLEGKELISFIKDRFPNWRK